MLTKFVRHDGYSRMKTALVSFPSTKFPAVSRFVVINSVRASSSTTLSSPSHTFDSKIVHVKNGKKRVKKTLRGRPISAMTVRDRQRRFVERNEIPLGRILMRGGVIRQSKRMLEMAEGRLTWIRDRLYKFWNPDYGSPDPSHPQSDQRQPQRPKKQATVMDGRWWFWNIVLAVSPAAFIGLYCEFRAKPRMIAYHRRNALEEMEEAFGKEFVEEHGEALLEEKLKRMQPQSWEEYLKEIYQGLGQLFLYVSKSTLPSGDDDDGTDSGKPDSTSLETRSSYETATAIPLQDSVPPLLSKRDVGSHDPEVESTEQGQRSLHEIVRRLKRLEALLDIQAEGREINNSSTKEMLQEKLQRLEGRDMRDRRHDRQREEWLELMASTKSDATGIPPNRGKVVDLSAPKTSETTGSEEAASSPTLNTAIQEALQAATKDVVGQTTTALRRLHGEIVDGWNSITKGREEKNIKANEKAVLDDDDDDSSTRRKSQAPPQPKAT